MLPGDSALAVYAIYADDCRATTGSPVRFWCGPDEMLKPRGVSITEGEYLRDWQDALDEELGRWLAETKKVRNARDLEVAHADALILNAGDELYDEAATESYYEPCGCLTNSANAHRASCPEYLGEVPWTDRVED
jgi:hypothetical protein